MAKKRLEILKRDRWKCKYCGSERKELHVHHLGYKKNKNPWDYLNDRLITLCRDCHHKVHDGRLIAFVSHPSPGVAPRFNK